MGGRDLGSWIHTLKKYDAMLGRFCVTHTMLCTDEAALAHVVRVKPARVPRKIAVEAHPTTDTCRVVSCHATATSSDDLQSISLFVHAFGYTFEEGCSYAIWFDSVFMPRSLVLNKFQSTGTATKSFLPIPVNHAFSETIDHCFIEKRSERDADAACL